MDNTKKYIGESPIKENPQKKLKIKLTDGAVTTDKLADGSVSLNKLAEDVTDAMQDVEHYGIIVSQELGDNSSISISQKKLTEEIDDINAIIATKADSSDVYNKSETYSTEETYNKEEVNRLFNPTSIIVLRESEFPPSNPDPAAIYRIQGTTEYSDKAYNGTEWITLATYSNIIDDDLTADSENLVKSSGIFNSLYRIREIPTTEWIRGDLKGSFGTTYAYYQSWDYMYLIPIEYASKVTITTGAYRAQIGFVTSTTMTNGGDVPFAEGETGPHTMTANSKATFNVPVDTKYIVCVQKTGENWAYPATVEYVYINDGKVQELKDYTDIELAKKQNVKYGVDLSSQNIIPSQDDVNGVANNQRATLRKMPVYKGDVFNVAKVNGVGTGTMLYLTFDKNMVQTFRSGWVDTFTIQQDGYVSVVVNSGVTDGGTAQFLLDALSMHRYIETIVKVYLEEKWGDDNDMMVFNNLLQNDKSKYYQFEGVSPFSNTLSCNHYMDVTGTQSMAIYNGLIFIFNKGVSVRIYDFINKFEVGSINAILPANQFECNSSWFSNEFYDPSDEFPILYSEAIYTSPAVCGFRIQRINRVWSITKVHEIYRDGETGGAIVFLDKQNDRLIYYINHNFISYQRPKYADSVSGVSTLYDTDIISTIENQDWQNMNFGQDKSCINHIAVGISNAVGSADINKVIGINLITGESIFKFTLPTPWGEGEGVEWYCGRLYVDDVYGHLYEIIFP